ncbi:MAG TPA: LuxR C-terminal-related transcriptional regulator [Candidatus Kapabacteria bacterium]|nr:LuxR C-terminal-related transcriptional regulator [Candidatus Kapabacteria bacterium]
MPRRREGVVRESIAQLVELTRRCEGGARARVRMLLAFKREPALTFEQLSATLGYSERNLHRWWSEYRRGGLALLLRGVSVEAQRRTRSPLLGTPTGGASPLGGSSPLAGSADGRATDLSARVARFLNAMPTTVESGEWMRRFHAGLKLLLAGVDVITLRVNLASEVEQPDHEMAELVIVDESSRNGGARGRRRVRAASVRTTPGRVLVAQMLAEGFPASAYQIPSVFDYFIEGGEYVGSIVLWRERTKTPIPDATLELMRTIHPFIAFALSDCVCRHVRHDPGLHAVRHIIDAIAARIGLRGRELEIFAMQLAGASRSEIAARQGIARSTVGKYVASIHAKAGTRNYTELLTRFSEADDDE